MENQRSREHERGPLHGPGGGQIGTLCTFGKATHVFQLVHVLKVEGDVKEGQERIHELELERKRENIIRGLLYTGIIKSSNLLETH